MLILISTDVQYLQNIAFSFEKDLNCKNHSSSGSHHPPAKFPITPSPPTIGGIPHTIMLFGKPSPVACIFKDRC